MSITTRSQFVAEKYVSVTDELRRMMSDPKTSADSRVRITERLGEIDAIKKSGDERVLFDALAITEAYISAEKNIFVHLDRHFPPDAGGAASGSTVAQSPKALAAKLPKK